MKLKLYKKFINLNGDSDYSFPRKFEKTAK